MIDVQRPKARHIVWPFLFQAPPEEKLVRPVAADWF
jgi:hypothetical protein